MMQHSVYTMYENRGGAPHCIYPSFAEMYFCWRKRERRYRQSLKGIRKPRQCRNNKSNEETEKEDAKDHGHAGCVDLAVAKPAAASPRKRPHEPTPDSIGEHKKYREDYKMLLHWVKKVDKNGRKRWYKKILYVSAYYSYCIRIRTPTILYNIYVLPHMRILSHTRMGRPIRVWDIPYAYGTILCPIRVWASHMSMHA